MSRRPSLHNPIPSSPAPEVYSDSRFHGQPGPSRHVRIPHVASYGGGAIAKSEDRHRCVVAGKESLRILRMSEPGTTSSEHKSVVGRGGYRIDASRNLWAGSGLKMDSSSTDVVWGHGTYSNKILTSARNGELIMWDLNKTGPSKYERRVKEHARAILNIAYSPILQYYCITGSADGYIRVWDLRDMSAAITQIRHPSPVRCVVLSPVSWRPLQAISALDNGSIHMWDLKMGQRGQLHRIPLAHSRAVLTLDWTLASSSTSSRVKGEPVSAPSQTSSSSGWYGNMGFGQFDDLGSLSVGSSTNSADGGGESDSSGSGWLASGGMDRCVKIWSLDTPSGEAHISRRPLYTLHTSYPVRRVLWRPGYECELAVVSNIDFDTGVKTSPPADSASASPSGSPHHNNSEAEDHAASDDEKVTKMSPNGVGDPVEIWDVRRG
ncbi:hypothetical protein NM688_g3378 [Phlebia brevispora]|uniref:Uncharacterized protein n=1 Tax=Phlebia brevispora TaxID=194682 RepID=A0ACC1T626_9APHY|nr:hypothetical protein NM688_g3378 [Phlebia brevispora]